MSACNCCWHCSLKLKASLPQSVGNWQHTAELRKMTCRYFDMPALLWTHKKGLDRQGRLTRMVDVTYWAAATAKAASWNCSTSTSNFLHPIQVAWPSLLSNSGLQTWPYVGVATKRGQVRGSAYLCMVSAPQKMVQHVHMLWNILTTLLTLGLAETASTPWSASFETSRITVHETVRHIIAPSFLLSSQPFDPVTHPTQHIVRHNVLDWYLDSL